MSDTLKTVLQIILAATYVKDLDISDPVDRLAKTYEMALASGDGDDEADKIFHDTRSLNASASEDLDLAGLLVDAFGATLNFAVIKAMVFKNNNTLSTLSIGGAAATQFKNWVGDVTDVVNVPPGGLFVLTAPAAGFAVGAGTFDLLKVAFGAGGNGTYDIILVGVGAA